MDMTPVNTDVVPEDIKKIYKEIGFQSNKAKLIFGDTIRRPWDLFFNRNYILERAYNINDYTKDIIEKYVQMFIKLKQSFIFRSNNLHVLYFYLQMHSIS